MRVLAVISFSFSAAILAANYFLPASVLPWLGGAALGFGFLLLLRRRKWLMLFVLCCFGLSAGCFCYFFHAQRTLIRALPYDGRTEELNAQALDYPQQYESYGRVEVKLLNEELSPLHAILYADGDALEGVEPGDRLKCTAKLKRADLRYGERYDSYLARDIYLTANAKSELQTESGGFSLRFLPVRLNRLLVDRIDRLFPADASAFMKSLMLGDKSDLYADNGLYLSMNRAGLLHVVAVSGMHIAFLVGLLQFLFGRTWRSSLLCLCLVWFFILVTGSPHSAVRAGIMQSFLLLAPLVRRENDPVTSLAVALALILLGNPFAAASIGLQLSFAAMAGILCLAEPLSDAIQGALSEVWAERLRGVIGTAASSLGVMAFSVPLMAIHFHAVPLLSPLTNLLCLWAVSLCFCLGYGICLLGFLLPNVGKLLGWVLAWLVRYLRLAAGLVSSLPFSTLSMKGLLPFLWIALVYLLILVAVHSRLKLRWKLLLPTVLACCSLAVMLGVTKAEYRSGRGVISVIDVGQGQCIAVMSGDKTLVVDCGGTYSLENAGETASAYLRACGREQIDLLVLTHLHADHCNGVPMLLEAIPVKELLMASDIPDEDGLLDGILQTAREKGTQVRILDEDAAIKLGDVQARLFMPGQSGRANERCLCAIISLGDYDMLITADSNRSTEKDLLARYDPKDMELLIVGHHGSRYASTGALLESIGADTAVISVGYNPYGHPTQETLDRLEAYGYTVYRTDLNGTLEFRLEA